jgi:septum formation protein
MSRIVLASGSPRRRELLAQIGIECTVIPSSVAEDRELPSPEETAEHLAVLKAQAVAGTLEGNGYVIGADTIVVVDGTIFGKPIDKEDARRMLLRLQGREHKVITGLAVILLNSQKMIAGHEVTTVKMRPLTSEEIDGYIGTGEPMDKAGAYAIQGRGAAYIPGICGCYFTVVGLPLARLLSMLYDLGWSHE